jgi:hypothetical protein
LGIGDWAQSPIPNPQSPIPNPQSPIEFYTKTQKNNYKIILINNLNDLKFFLKINILHSYIIIIQKNGEQRRSYRFNP